MLGLGDACTKIRLPVGELLQENHPPLQEIYAANTINSTFEFY